MSQAREAATAPMLNEWSAALLDERVHFQLAVLDGGIYLWIGCDDARLDSLAVGVPAAVGGRSGGLPSATTLLGGGDGDASSQLLAQRLSCKFGRPVIVSLNLRDDPQLRIFAEREALRALAVYAPSAAPAAAVAAPAAAASCACAPSALPAAPSSAAAARAGGIAGADGGADGPGRGARTREVFDDADALAARHAGRSAKPPTLGALVSSAQALQRLQRPRYVPIDGAVGVP
jgi:hypothetical protein